MNRRQFIQSAGAAATAGLGGLSAATALAASGDGSSRLQQAMSILSSAIVIDGLDVSDLNAKYVGMLRNAKVTAWYRSMGGLQSFANTYRFVDANPGVKVARSVKEIQHAHASGSIALILGWQSADTLNDSGASPALLRAYYELGLRICGIAYNLANTFGGGSLEPHLGLTRAGRLLVERIHELGIVLDVGGHTGEQTSLDAIGVSAGRPIICSHANVKTLNDNARCISDRLIDAIVKTGGVIGLTAVSDYMMRTRNDSAMRRSPRAPLSAYLDQFDYLRKRVGVEHIAIAPDFIEGRAEYSSDKGRNRHLFPSSMMGEWPYDYVDGFDTIEKLPNVVSGLLERNWSSADIRKVLGANLMRVYGSVWSS